MDFSSALRHLSEAQKPGRGVSLYTRFVNRPAGRLLAAAAHRAGLTPNQVTATSAVVTSTALVAIACCRPVPALGPWVALALVLGFALDSADGQLARLHRTAGPTGEWTDHVVDCGKLLGVHAAVLISFYRFFDLPHQALLLAPLVFQFSAVLLFFGGILTEQLRGRRAGPEPGHRPLSTVRGMALLPLDYGLLCLTFAFLGHRQVFFALYATLLAAHAALLPAFLVKWYRELSGRPAAERSRALAWGRSA
ncbi:CDP-alcohol phosphatidyltransferase family protein [Streptomyces collinus]|uniref:CDP-alcohol phosphatidyltransferase family protein n=1 Tax=Streptomyces collinus TaxID=42684 RepID=UPI0036C07145